ncbi:MAG: lipopolysaccharide assembly LapA domain-containing protein [Betaproteobacteria bacterium]
MKYFAWLLKAALFFTLFAFALNNQNPVAVHFFFGQQWEAPLVLVLMLAFAAGLALGIVFMVPRWWRSRKAAQMSAQTQADPLASANPNAATGPHGV